MRCKEMDVKKNGRQSRIIPRVPPILPYGKKCAIFDAKYKKCYSRNKLQMTRKEVLMKEDEFKLVISIIPLFTALIPIVTSFIKDKFARKWRCTRRKSALDKYMNHFLKVYWWSSVIFIVSIGVSIGVSELIENIVDIEILDEWSFAVASAVYILIIIFWMNRLKIDSDKCELIRFKKYLKV